MTPQQPSPLLNPCNCCRIVDACGNAYDDDERPPCHSAIQQEPGHPIPTDEQCRICQIATRKDEREQWKKGILKFTEEDPLLMAYAVGYKAGKKDATGKVRA